VTKDFKQYSIDLGQRESRNTYGIENVFHFLGRWQLGSPRIYDLGYSINGWYPKGQPIKKVITKTQFLTDIPLQNKLFIDHITRLKNHVLSNHAERIDTDFVCKDGKKYNLTLSGIVSGMHLIGSGGIDKFLRTQNDSADGFDTKASDYITEFAGYDLYSNIEIG
jgi:hypothetical protein